MLNKRKYILSLTTILLMILLFACDSFDDLSPRLVAEWKTGEIQDIVLSADSKYFAANYRIMGSSKNVVQIFSTDTLTSAWTIKDSLAKNLAFAPDGLHLIESNIFAPYIYWRRIEDGQVIKRVDLTKVDENEGKECNGGGQILAINSKMNTVLILDASNLIGPNTNNIIVIRELNLDEENCRELIKYQGTFDVFDISFDGNLIAFGGEGKEDDTVIWNIKKDIEVCRIPSVEFGRFMPSKDVLVVVKDKKTAFVNSQTCQQIREFDISPAVDYENYIAISPNGKWLAVTTSSIQIIDTFSSELLTQIPFPDNSVPISNKLFVNGIKFSPDGKYLLIAYYLLEDNNNGLVQLWKFQE